MQGRDAEAVPFLHCQNNFTRRQLSLSSSRGRQTDPTKKKEAWTHQRSSENMRTERGRRAVGTRFGMHSYPADAASGECVLHKWSSAGAKLWQRWASVPHVPLPLMVIDFVELKNKLISVTAAAFIVVPQCVGIYNTHSHTHVATHLTHTKIGVGAKRSTMLPACMTSSKTGSKSDVKHTVCISSHVLMLQQGCTIIKLQYTQSLLLVWMCRCQFKKLFIHDALLNATCPDLYH